MESQGKLLEMLQEMKEIAAAQHNQMTREEINRYLGGQFSSEEQLRAVYQYLGENGIKVEGYAYIPPTEKPAAEEEALITSYLHGETALKNRIVELRLGRVLELAERYKKRALPQEEIIAEGNVGLLTAMRVIEKNPKDYLRQDGTLDREKFFGTLDLEIVHAMECYIDEETASKDWEHTVLAKRNLLYEAEKYLAEELGRIPDLEELSAYTRIAPDEIKSILELSKDAGGRK